MNVLVGREREVGAVRSLVDSLPAGGVVVLEGEPGIGKSALVDMACARAAASGVTVCRAAADPVVAAAPFGLMTELVRTTRAGRRDSAPGAHALDVLETVLAHLDASAASGPLLLALDDLHWADEGSLTVLAGLLRREVPHGLAVIATHRAVPRPPGLDLVLDEVSRLGQNEFTVPPLRTNEVVALARTIVGVAPGSALRTLLDDAGGNPFYIEVLLRDLMNAGRIVVEDDHARLLAGATPESLQRILVRRARMLGDDAEAVLRSAAVLAGAVGSLDDVAALSGVALERCREIVTAACDADLLTEHGATIRFRHDLVATALLDATPSAVRLSLHAAAAALVGDRNPAAVVPHLLTLDDPGRSATELARLARQCSPELGVALIARFADHYGDDRLLLDVARADLLLWSGSLDAAITLGQQLIDEHPGDLRVDPVVGTVAHARFLQGEAREYSASVPDEPDPDAPITVARYQAEWSIGHMFAAAFDKAERLARSALVNVEAQRAADADGTLADDSSISEVVARSVLGYVLCTGGTATEGLDQFARMAAALEDAPPDASFAGPDLFRAAALDALGHGAEALTAIDDDERRPTSIGSIARTPVRHSIRALVLFNAGRWDDALEEAAAGLAVARETAVSVTNGYLIGVPAVVAGLRGDAASARSLALQSTGPGAGSDLIARALALAAELDGDSSGAAAILGFTAQTMLDVGWTVIAADLLPHLARLDEAAGDTARCLALVDAIEPLLDATTSPLPAAQVAVARATLTRDVAALVSAADALDQIGRPHPAACARMLAAQWAGKDAGPLRASVLDMLGALGVPVPDTTPARRRRTSDAPTFGWGALTGAERSVVTELAQGRTNTEIAARLHLSRRTVETHLAHVYTKVGLNNRLAVAREVLRQQADGTW